MSSTPLSMQSGPDGTLVLAGDADETALARLRHGLDTMVTEHDTVRVDLSGIGFLPSAAIGVIARAGSKARSRGGDVVILVTEGSRAERTLHYTGVPYEIVSA